MGFACVDTEHMVSMDTIAFARGVPAPEMLPVDQLRQAATRAFQHDTTALLSYGTGGGWPPLRTWLGELHGVDPNRVVLTTGSLQGFGLLAQVLASRAARDGRRARVLVENPTYDRPRIVLERLGIEVVEADLDEDGLDVDAAERILLAGDIDMAYVIPTFQNPAGSTMPEARRRRLVDIARASGVLVLEDDPYGRLHFDEPAPATLFGRDPQAPIAFSGSFSKTIAPGLRVGWLVLPEDLAAEVARFANDTYISASFLGQATVHEFLMAGEWQPNIERCRELLAERCRRICDALDRHLPDASWHRPAGGYFIWIQLPDGLDAARVSDAAGAHGVSFVAGSAFGPGLESWARLAFSSPPIDQIEIGVERLAAACSEVRAIA